jgi:hypothetical protein
MLGVEEDISDEDIEPKKDEEKDELLEQIRANQAEKEQGKLMLFNFKHHHLLLFQITSDFPPLMIITI